MFEAIAEFFRRLRASGQRSNKIVVDGRTWQIHFADGTVLQGESTDAGQALVDATKYAADLLEGPRR